MLPWRHIVLATDFSSCSEQATDAAIELAEKFEAALTVVHALEYPTYVYTAEAFTPVDLLAPLEQGAEKALAQALERVRKKIPRAQSILRRGSPALEVVAVAKEVKADLLVIGTHGRRGPTHFLLGSVAERVVQHAQIPVLTIRPASK